MALALERLPGQNLADVLARNGPLPPEHVRAIMRDGKYDLTLFGHRGSISDPYDTLEMYHSKNAFEVGLRWMLIRAEA